MSVTPMFFSGDEFDDVYLTLMSELVNAPTVPSRNGMTQEILGCSLVVGSAYYNWPFSRKMSPCYAAGELLWYLSGTDDGEQILAYAPSYSQFLSTDGKAHGAYGRRWKNQIPKLLHVLGATFNTRQAIIQAWDPELDLGSTEPDLPCTLSLQFLGRSDRLNLVSTMRSNDAWLGLPYDAFCFTSMLRLFAEHVGAMPGAWVHNVGSMHLYQRDIEKVKARVLTAEAVQSQIPFQPIRAGTLPRMIASAVELEKLVRTFPPEIKKLEDLIVDACLDFTLLGACVMLCWMNRCGFVETSFVPNALLHETHEWLERRAKGETNR